MAQSLLEPVAAGQTRFRLHGLFVDARGVAVGREILAIFETIDRLVGFLGAYSEEMSLDELFLSMTLETGRREGGGRAFLLRCQGGDSYAVERIRRLASVVQSVTYTGAGSIFILPRDRQTPFGFDLANPAETVGAVGPDDVVAVSETYATRLRVIDRLDPIELVQRLSMRPQPIPGDKIDNDPELCGLREMALVLVSPGLSSRITSWLWRRQVAMAGIRLSLRDGEPGSLLLRLRTPPGRILDILQAIPGVELFVPVSSRAAVQVGWRHPIHLASANACLPGDEMYLFRGRADRVERIPGSPKFVDGTYLVEHELSTRPPDDEEARLLAPEISTVSLSLRTTNVAREPSGVLIAWSQASMIGGLLYLLPPSVLRSCEFVTLKEGVLVLSERGGGGRIGASAMIPLGRRMVEAAPGVLVPDGHELWPRVRPQLVRELLGLEAEELAVYPDDAAACAIRIPAAQRMPLDARAVRASTPVLAEVVSDPPGSLDTDPTISNERLGRFALWRYRGES